MPRLTARQAHDRRGVQEALRVRSLRKDVNVGGRLLPMIVASTLHAGGIWVG